MVKWIQQSFSYRLIFCQSLEITTSPMVKWIEQWFYQILEEVESRNYYFTDGEVDIILWNGLRKKSLSLEITTSPMVKWIKRKVSCRSRNYYFTDGEVDTNTEHLI